MKPILCPVLILAASSSPCGRLERRFSKAHRKATSNPTCLCSICSTRPEPVQRFYAAAYGVLAADPRATFVAVCGDPESAPLQRAWPHPFDGPMLGAVTADGARVWLRTVGPASVEVRVTVNGEERAFGLSELRRDGSGRGGAGRRSGTSHATYRVLVDGKPIALPGHAAIVTTPAPEETGRCASPLEAVFTGGASATPPGPADSRAQSGGHALIGDIAAQDETAIRLHRADTSCATCNHRGRARCRALFCRVGRP